MAIDGLQNGPNIVMTIKWHMTTERYTQNDHKDMMLKKRHKISPKRIEEVKNDKKQPL